jgi:hypothetical protein
MLAAGENPFCLHAFQERGGGAGNFVGTPAIASIAEGVVRLFVDGEIQNRCEVPVESEKPEELTRKGPVPKNEGGIPSFAQIASTGWFVSDLPQPRDTSSFLIHREEGREGRKPTKFVEESTELFGRAEIPGEENKTRRANVLDEFARGQIDFRTWYPQDEKLPPVG